MGCNKSKILRVLTAVMISLVLILPAAVPVWAALPFYFSGNNLVGDENEYVYAVAVGDLDNDGDLDIVSGDNYDHIYIWENDGTPFTDAWNSLDIGSAEGEVYSLALGDLDNDGDLDIVSGDDDYYIYIWENDGTPFNDTWNSQEVGECDDYVDSVAVGDLDKDGWLDIVSGDEDYYVYAWENDQTPFNGTWDEQEVGYCSDDVYAVAVGDFDNDGWLDVVSGDNDYYVYVWENDGTPFDDTWDGQEVGECDDDVRAVALGDFDCDGWLDIVSGDEDYDVTVWENDGTPFDNEWNYRVIGECDDYVIALAVGDFNNDGCPDIVSGDEDGELIVWENDRTPFDGDWEYLLVYTTSESEQYINAVAVGDLDNDGDLDIVSGDDDYYVIAHRNQFEEMWHSQGAGGEVDAVNKLGLAAPWLVLAGLAAAGFIFFLRRRSTASK